MFVYPFSTNFSIFFRHNLILLYIVNRKGDFFQMDFKKIQSITTQIAQNLTNQALVTELLTQLNDLTLEGSTAIENLTKQAQDQSQTIADLQRTNMNLFLRVGNPVESPKVNTTEPLQYDDLIKSMEGTK